jgi:hypothetical protein
MTAATEPSVTPHPEPIPASDPIPTDDPTLTDVTPPPVLISETPLPACSVASKCPPIFSPQSTSYVTLFASVLLALSAPDGWTGRLLKAKYLYRASHLSPVAWTGVSFLDGGITS